MARQKTGETETVPAVREEMPMLVTPPNVPRPDVSHGGISADDMIMPRVVLVQPAPLHIDTYPGIPPGSFVSNITKEYLPTQFIPLFAFKFYAKMDKDRNMEWGTIDRNDPRVVEGLRWETDAEGNRSRAVMESLNFLVGFNDDFAAPYILTFRKSSLGIGKQFLSLLRMKCARDASGIPYDNFYAHRYTIVTKRKENDKGIYYVPVIDSPKDKGEADVPPEVQQRAVRAVEYYLPLMSQIAEVNQPGVDNEGENQGYEPANQ